MKKAIVSLEFRSETEKYIYPFVGYLLEKQLTMEICQDLPPTKDFFANKKEVVGVFRHRENDISFTLENGISNELLHYLRTYLDTTSFPVEIISLNILVCFTTKKRTMLEKFQVRNEGGVQVINIHPFLTVSLKSQPNFQAGEADVWVHRFLFEFRRSEEDEFAWWNLTEGFETQLSETVNALLDRFVEK